MAQSDVVFQGGEYALTEPLAGDQVQPAAAVGLQGGYVVWEDEFTDGQGQGISARRLDASFSGMLSVFRVNQTAQGDQTRPAVITLSDGGAVFTWLSGPSSQAQVMSRFLGSNGLWRTSEIRVNVHTNSGKQTPTLARLNDNSVVIIWTSWNQEGGNRPMLDVFGRKFSPTGEPLGTEFKINLTTPYNQRTPAVAGLSDGRFVVVWVSEQQRFENSVDIYARLFRADGSPVSGEILINMETNVCANPQVAALPGGGFLVVWGQKDTVVRQNSWDIWSRAFDARGNGGAVRRLNTHTYGDQFAPRVAVAGERVVVVWTSLAQDGSREGVFGRVLDLGGMPLGGEIQLNTTTRSQQIHPVVASDGSNRFLVVWSSFTDVAHGFDLQAQRLASAALPLQPLDPPVVSVLSSNALSVSWATVAGLPVQTYEVYMNGAEPPQATVVTPRNVVTISNLLHSTTYSFRVAYVLTNGQRSPLSAAASNTTYGPWVYGGIPSEWMAAYFGPDLWAWPRPQEDSDGDGATNGEEFLAGTDPRNPNSVLRVNLRHTPMGWYLEWNTQPGLVYQVQSAGGLTGWTNLGEPRFARGTAESVRVEGSHSAFYRVIRLR
ncbi:MAG: fibronectin type III domain-containing protein [Verrucomicrobiota bacterium]|nr:fibronectin type III domain-containing protein [Limisphaera sp.]MDW8381398.1 fibronectin type III domain-containing protein [Verrucomicrobiota bacterium]